MFVNKVTNPNGTRCRCGTWLSHWIAYVSRVPTGCSVVGCSGTADIGAHVRPAATLGAADAQTFVVPLCYHHQAQDGPFNMKDLPVRANISETCGR